MSSPSPTPRGSRHGRQSLFFRDLASPISAAARGSSGGRFSASASGLWREGGGPESPPPPPVFTLDDRATDFPPEAGVGELPPPSPAARSRTPPPAPAWGSSPPPISRSRSLSSPSAFRARAEVNGGTPAAAQKTPESSTWLHEFRSPGGEEAENGRAGSPVDGVVQPGALITLPPRWEAARPEVRGLPNGGNLDEEEWVTVFGFSPSETNLIVREFEKCGSILKHISGPRDANWMHILYQDNYDAQKALRKNGTQINSILIIGVKPVDPMHRQFLNEKLSEQRGFMVSLPSKSRSAAGPAVPRPYNPQTGTDAANGSRRCSSKSLASPAKSAVSRVMDLIFGL